MSARPWISSRTFAAAALIGAGLSLSGCPSDLCLIEINGRCKVNNCGAGQAYANNLQRCVCERGRVNLGGSCLTMAEANQYCGKGNRYTPQGCVRIVCPRGSVMDVASGQCTSKSQIDKNAGVGPGQTLACKAGTVLVVNAGKANCVPIEETCTGDEHFDGKRCVKSPKCPENAAYDASIQRCVILTKPPTSSGDRPQIDLVMWAQSTYGPRGGKGSQALCGPLARKPRTFGVMPGSSATIGVHLEFRFTDGKSETAQVATIGRVKASGMNVTPQGAQEIQNTANQLLTSLRAQRSTPRPASLVHDVACIIVNGAAPTTVPATGGI